MAKVEIMPEYCKGCGLCINYCPKKVLGLSEGINEFGYRYAVMMDEENCITCAICSTVCPDIAIKVNK